MALVESPKKENTQFEEDFVARVRLAEFYNAHAEATQQEKDQYGHWFSPKTCQELMISKTVVEWLYRKKWTPLKDISTKVIRQCMAYFSKNKFKAFGNVHKKPLGLGAIPGVKYEPEMFDYASLSREIRKQEKEATELAQRYRDKSFVVFTKDEQLNLQQSLINLLGLSIGCYISIDLVCGAFDEVGIKSVQHRDANTRRNITRLLNSVARNNPNKVTKIKINTFFIHKPITAKDFKTKDEEKI